MSSSAPITIRDFPVHGDLDRAHLLMDLVRSYRSYFFDEPGIVSTTGMAVGPYFMCLKDGQIVPGTSRGQRGLKYTPSLIPEGPGRFRISATASRTRIEGEIVAVGGRNIGSLAGWVMEIMPRLMMLKEWPQLEGKTFVMRPLTMPFQQETLELLGFNARVLSYDIVDADRLHIPEHMVLPRGKAQISPAIVRHNRAFAARYAVEPKNPMPRRVYLLTNDASRQDVANEAEIVRSLTAAGFVALNTARFSLQEQMALFRTAECIVAPNCSALGGLSFCEPGTHVVELYSESHGAVSPYWNVSSLAGLDYRMVLGRPQSEDGPIVIAREHLVEAMAAIGIALPNPADNAVRSNAAASDSDDQERQRRREARKAARREARRDARPPRDG